MTTYNKPTRIHIQIRDPKNSDSKTRTVYNIDLGQVDAWIDGMLKARKLSSEASKNPSRVHIQIKDPVKLTSASKTVYGEKLETIVSWIDRLLEVKVGSAKK